jgi:hypothetical protein
MDFIVGFSLTARRHESIFLVVDTLTKSEHSNPVHGTYQVLGIARVFIQRDCEIAWRVVQEHRKQPAK